MTEAVPRVPNRHGPPLPGRRWLRVFSRLALLWALSVGALVLTGTPLLVPTVILLGSFLVPVTVVLYDLEHRSSGTLPREAVLEALVYGGVLGVLATSVLGAWLLDGPSTSWVAIALVEEIAKGVALAVVAYSVTSRSMADGLVLGAAVGLGFAALESGGYALMTMLAAQESPVAGLVGVTVLRGVLAPFGHGVWTAILGGVLFRESRGRHLRPTWAVARALALVVVLHGAWNGAGGLATALTAQLAPPGVAWRGALHDVLMLVLMVGVVLGGFLVSKGLLREARQRLHAES